jgi:Transglycosylase SLT domain
MWTPLALWALSIMVYLQPAAPWLDSYPTTATALAYAAEDAPLFKGPHGTEQTVALLLSIAWFESRFDPSARGDHGASLGLFQIAPGTAGSFVAKDDLLDPALAARTALRLVRQSFAICQERPQDERLAWYTHGGPDCSPLGVSTSRNRMLKAAWLFAHKPPPSCADDGPC